MKNHCFDVALATTLGVVEAIVLAGVENASSFFPDALMVVAKKDLLKAFPYLSERRIFNALEKLNEEGLIYYYVNCANTYTIKPKNDGVKMGVALPKTKMSKEEKEEKWLAKERDFSIACYAFREEFEEEMIKEFIAYWSEPNRSRTKMRWELQPTFDIKRRLETWRRNNESRYGVREARPKGTNIDQLMKKTYGIK